MANSCSFQTPPIPIRELIYQGDAPAGAANARADAIAADQDVGAPDPAAGKPDPHAAITLIDPLEVHGRPGSIDAIARCPADHQSRTPLKRRMFKRMGEE